MSNHMQHHKFLAPIAVAALFALTACGNHAEEQPENATSASSTVATQTTETASPATTTSTATATSTETTPVLSGGTAGGAQAPNGGTESAITSISEADQQAALTAGKTVIEQYSAGGEHDEWFKTIAPNLTAEMQTQLQNFNPEPSKAKVTGEAEKIDDVNVQADNPYWITVKVPTDKGEYAVRLVRTAERPDKWKANEILPITVFQKEQAG